LDLSETCAGAFNHSPNESLDLSESSAGAAHLGQYNSESFFDLSESCAGAFNHSPNEAMDLSESWAGAFNHSPNESWTSPNRWQARYTQSGMKTKFFPRSPLGAKSKTFKRQVLQNPHRKIDWASGGGGRGQTWELLFQLLPTKSDKVARLGGRFSVATKSFITCVTM